MNLVALTNRIIYSFFLLFILVPLFLTPWNYELFEFNKMIVTYALTIIIFSAWLVKMSVRRTISIRRTPLDIPIIVFVVSQLISALFSMDPHVSWFGYYSRFNGGMLSIFTYVLLYYAFLSNYSNEEDNSQPAITKTSLTHLLMTIVGTAIIVCIYGILQRMGIDKSLWVQDVQNRIFSTLGQPNWLAAYLAALIPLSLAFTVESQKNEKPFTFSPAYIVWLTLSAMFFITLLFTKSRSGVLALGVSILIFIVLLLFKTAQKHVVIKSLSVPILLFFIIASVVKTSIPTYDKYFTIEGLKTVISRSDQTTPTQQTEPQTSTMMESGGTESGTIRKYVWEAAITAWKSSQKAFFIGTGTETFAFAFFRHKGIQHNLTSEWDFLYNKAHNEYLNYLTTTGLLGLVAYVSFLVTFSVWFKVKTLPIFSKYQQKDINTVDIALFAGWCSILITNFFGFSVVIMQLFLFLFPAFVFAYTQKNTRTIYKEMKHLPNGVSAGLSFVGLFVALICLGYISVYWIADTYFAQGQRQSRQGQLGEAYRSLSQALLLRPSEPLYYDELGVTLSSLSVAAMEAGDATTASSLAQQSLLASDKALAISPNNVNFWKSRTKIYFGFADVTEEFVRAAIESLEKALSLSPSDPKITYNLAVLYGRIGLNDKSIELLKETIRLKPNYRDAYFALYIFYQEIKQPALARSILEEYLSKVDPNDKDFKDRLSQPDPTTLP
jgi:putative inorganic carbon (hco3(-)) transporter